MKKSTLAAPGCHFERFFMTFGSHFDIDFLTFSEMAKTFNSLHRAYFWKVFPSKNRSFFDPFFINFLTFAPEPLLESILGAKSADLCWNGRFLVPLRISRSPKSAPGPRSDPAERVGTVFAIRCFTILHCTSPHITLFFKTSPWVGLSAGTLR